MNHFLSSWAGNLKTVNLGVFSLFKPSRCFLMVVCTPRWPELPTSLTSERLAARACMALEGVRENYW